MHPHCSVFIATSVDGFIARRDGALDWLTKPEFLDQRGLGLPYERFIATVDAIVMGRKTFETARDFPEWPYEGRTVVVLSARELALPPRLHGKVVADGGAPAAIAARLAAAGHRHLYIDGGQTIRRFLAAGLIGELTLTRVPVLLGDGIPLFAADGGDSRLEHLQTSAAANGLVQSRYRVLPPA